MLSLWEVLKASNGLPVDNPLAELWGRRLAGGYTVDEIEGELPLTIRSDGSELVDYRIYGNTVQGGEPSPDEPVEVVGVGKRTVNLLPPQTDNNTWVTGYLSSDGTSISQSNSYKTTDFIELKEGDYYFRFSRIAASGSWYRYTLFNENKEKLISNSAYNSHFSFNNTTAKYIRISCNLADWIMFVKGSTAPDHYIPYGYEVDVETRGINEFDVRKIISIDMSLGKRNGVEFKTPGKYTIVNFGATGGYLYARVYDEYSDTIASLNIVQNGMIRNGTLSVSKGQTLKIFDAINNSLSTSINLFNDWELFVKSGTAIPNHYEPYHEPITTSVYIGDEPLHEGEYVDYGNGKIYRYADGVLTPTDPPVPLPAIPTFDGTTIIDVNTDPKPEKAYIKYRKGQ